MEAFILAAAVGVLIGICSGLLGIGGGTLMVPLFRLGFGMSALASTATSLFTIIPTSLVGCSTHIKNKTCIPRLGLICGVAGACASPLGVLFASISPSWLVMLVAGIIIGYSAFSMFRKAMSLPKTPAGGATGARACGAQANAQSASEQGVQQNPQPATDCDAQANLKPTSDQDASASDAFSLTGSRLALSVGIGLFAGLCSGYVGVGGGFIMVPLFVSVLGVMMHQASGTSLIAVTILAIPGAITQGMLGNIDYLVGIAMAVGSIPGAALGASLIRKVPERQLRFLFGAFLLVAAVVLVVEECTPLLA